MFRGKWKDLKGFFTNLFSDRGVSSECPGIQKMHRRCNQKIALAGKVRISAIEKKQMLEMSFMAVSRLSNYARCVV
jgi:hypothetical protein